MLRDWIAEDRAQWDVIRRKLRFVGGTVRRKTSPNTFRWQLHAPFTRQLPARAVLNVCLHWRAWTYLADRQVKLTLSYPGPVACPGCRPDHGEPTRQALAEAVGVNRLTTGSKASQVPCCCGCRQSPPDAVAALAPCTQPEMRDN